MKKNAEHESVDAAGPEASGKEAEAVKTTADIGDTVNTAGEAKSDAGTAQDAQTSGEKSAEEKSAEPKGSDLAARVAELEKINAELQDQYLRKAADFDNYRKRMIKEKQDAIDFANSNLLVDLVEILDNFDRAIASIGSADAGASASSFKEGVSMIRSQLGTLLETKYGLTYYPAKGASFDPNLHEAIGTAASPDVKEPTVAEEFVKGYKLKDRIIRHAKVMVHTPA